MSDLIDQPEPGQNAPEFSVSDISGAVKRLIEGEFFHVRIRGEVGRVSRPRSGHGSQDHHHSPATAQRSRGATRTRPATPAMHGEEHSGSAGES